LQTAYVKLVEAVLLRDTYQESQPEPQLLRLLKGLCVKMTTIRRQALDLPVDEIDIEVRSFCVAVVSWTMRILSEYIVFFNTAYNDPYNIRMVLDLLSDAMVAYTRDIYFTDVICGTNSEMRTLLQRMPVGLPDHALRSINIIRETKLEFEAASDKHTFVHKQLERQGAYADDATMLASMIGTLWILEPTRVQPPQLQPGQLSPKPPAQPGPGDIPQATQNDPRRLSGVAESGLAAQPSRRRSTTVLAGMPSTPRQRKKSAVESAPKRQPRRWSLISVCSDESTQADSDEQTLRKAREFAVVVKRAYLRHRADDVSNSLFSTSGTSSLWHKESTRRSVAPIIAGSSGGMSDAESTVVGSVVPLSDHLLDIVAHEDDSDSDLELKGVHDEKSPKLRSDVHPQRVDLHKPKSSTSSPLVGRMQRMSTAGQLFVQACPHTGRAFALCKLARCSLLVCLFVCLFVCSQRPER
jgi:hypothetical protein